MHLTQGVYCAAIQGQGLCPCCMVYSFTCKEVVLVSLSLYNLSINSILLILSARCESLENNE